MQSADWVILAIIVASMFFGLMRGFVREAFSLAGWLAAFVVARIFFAPFDIFLESSIGTPSVRHAMAYAGLFVGTLILAWLLGYAVMSLVDAAGLKMSDRLLGMGFGMLRGAIIVLALLVFLAPFVNQDRWWQEALLPKAFMRYELLGRTLKDKVVDVTLPAGDEPEGQQPFSRH